MEYALTIFAVSVRVRAKNGADSEHKKNWQNKEMPDGMDSKHAPVVSSKDQIQIGLWWWKIAIMKYLEKFT